MAMIIRAAHHSSVADARSLYRLPGNHSSLASIDPQKSNSRILEKAPTTTDDVVELSGVRFSWHAGSSPVVAIDSLRVARGERLLLRGPSGSGKSTLLSLLAGVLKAQSGSVRVLGHELGALAGTARDRFRADHIGVIFQMFNLIPYLSVRENVCLPCAFSRRRRDRCEQSGTSVRDVAARLLDHLDMGGEEMLRRQVTELSVGQQQRVAAARSRIGAPELVIADIGLRVRWHPTDRVELAREILVQRRSVLGDALEYFRGGQRRSTKRREKQRDERATVT